MRHAVHTAPADAGRELSDAELEAVAGGKELLGKLPPITIGPFPSRRAGAVRTAPAPVPAVSPAGGCAGGVCRP